MTYKTPSFNKAHVVTNKTATLHMAKWLFLKGQYFYGCKVIVGNLVSMP